MPLSEAETLASLRVLVCMARADGVLHEKERAVLEAGLEDVELPEGITLQTLLDETIDIDREIEQLKSEDARMHAYTSAFAIAYTDGECAPEEQTLLDRLRRRLRVPEDRQQTLQNVFAGEDEGDEVGEGETTAVLDEKVREIKVTAETRKCAVVTALLGAFPVPGLAVATDLAVAGLQVGLARDIGGLYGQKIDRETAKGILAGFGVGTGVRIALTNLIKMFPGWGSAVGAAAAYASTYAVGRAMNTYFARGRGMDPAELKAVFEKAKAEGKKLYKEDAKEIDAKRQEHKEALSELAAKLKAGEIDQTEFERRSAALREAISLAGTEPVE